jgi:hypothetical protein
MLGTRGINVCWYVLAAVLVVALLPLDGSVTLALDESAMDLADMMLQESSSSPPVPTPPAMQQLLDPVFPDLDVTFLPFRPPA